MEIEHVGTDGVQSMVFSASNGIGVIKGLGNSRNALLWLYRHAISEPWGYCWPVDYIGVGQTQLDDIRRRDMDQGKAFHMKSSLRNDE